MDPCLGCGRRLMHSDLVVSFGLRDPRRPQCALACIQYMGVCCACHPAMSDPCEIIFCSGTGFHVRPQRHWSTLKAGYIKRANCCAYWFTSLLQLLPCASSLLFRSRSSWVRRTEVAGASGCFSFGLMTGCVASFLFRLILTLVARKLGPARLWLWLLLGGLLGPGVIFVLASIGKMYAGAGPFNFVFWEPETLLQVWWLALPAGVFTAWICYAIYPWGFSQSHQTSRTE
jgi:hypothetical protein